VLFPAGISVSTVQIWYVSFCYTRQSERNREMGRKFAGEAGFGLNPGSGGQVAAGQLQRKLRSGTETASRNSTSNYS
jgi:hypothetical protein